MNAGRSEGRGAEQGADTLRHALPPVAAQPRYNERLPGVFGEFGSGSGLQAFYLQTTISPQYLRKISLVKDIPGSERWRVRDLFQREVDHLRVAEGLVPYLADRERIKFFNALILTVLPMDETNGHVLAQMPRVVEKAEEEAGREWLALEREGLFRVRWPRGQEEYAEFQWNSDRSRIVAIDGQHRLSALKRYSSAWTNVQRTGHGDLDEALGEEPPTSSGSFLDWRIPVIVVSFRAVRDRKEPPSVLEVVRSIFVDINTKAQRVGEARKVLLDDTSVNAVAAQELLEHAHANDLLDRAARRRETAPLLLFDWRGIEEDGQPIAAPAAVKTIVEVRDWFRHYILGEDFCEFQAEVLDVQRDERFACAWERERLDYAASRLMRERVTETVVPAVCHLLENFAPYRSYIRELRDLEDRCYSGHGLHRYAFDRLRFGFSCEERFTKFEVDDIERALVVEIKRAREECLRPAMPISHDIGLRGVVHAFSELLYQFGCFDWMEYAEWFTSGLNRVYADGWFEAEHGGNAHDYLRHVVLNQNETVVNYRLQDAAKALGPYVGLLVGAHAAPPEYWEADWGSLRNKLLATLRSTLVRGYRKQVRPDLLDEYPNRGRELTQAVNAQASRLAGRQMRRFERRLEEIAASPA